MDESQEELEQVAKAYELISANNPPDLKTPLLICVDRAQDSIKPLKSKLSEQEILDNLLWKRAIESNKEEISKNILITAEKAKALTIKSSTEGEFYKFKGSDEWLNINEYAETLLHQPFEDQLTHLFRFLLVEEFSNKRDLDNYSSPNTLKEFYFDKEVGYPNKFFFSKALHKNFNLFIWQEKEWFLLDQSANQENSVSLKHHIESKFLKEKFKEKIYFDGFTQSLAESIYDSIKHYSSPFAEYEHIATILSLFKDFISLTLVLEKLESLGYKNKNFILELASKESHLSYINHAELTLRSWLKESNTINVDNLKLPELLKLSGKKSRETLKEFENIKDNFILAGLSLLIKQLEQGSSFLNKAIGTNKDYEDDMLNAYTVFLPWWHAVSNLTADKLIFEEIKSALEFNFKNTLSGRDSEYQDFQNSNWAGQVQMKLLDSYECLKLSSLSLDTPSELVENEKKQKAWVEVEIIITSAYQHKISRSALSEKLSKAIKANKPYLDKASKRLKQLLDLYEKNLLNN
jgi:hypothetical protein